MEKLRMPGQEDGEPRNGVQDLENPGMGCRG